MKKTIHFLIAVLIYILFFAYVLYKAAGNGLDFGIYLESFKIILRGWINTIFISFVALFFSLLVGIILYVMGKSKLMFIRYLSEFHKSIVFGVPLVIIIIASYYYVGDAFGIDSKFAIGVITLSMYTGAYICDIYRGAIEGVHPRQWQAAKMFGFTKWQTYRYIIFPQVIMSILPPLTGQLALLIKGSALLAYIMFNEFFNVIKTVQSYTFAYAEGYVIVALGYLAMTIPLLLLIKKLEKRLNFRG